MAFNKVPDVHAMLVPYLYLARVARTNSDASVLVLPAKISRRAPLPRLDPLTALYRREPLP